MEAEILKAVLVIGLIIAYSKLADHMRKKGIPVPGDIEEE